MLFMVAISMTRSLSLSREKTFTTIFNIPAYELNSDGNEVNLVSRQKNNLFATMRDCELVLRYFALKDENKHQRVSKNNVGPQNGKTKGH